MAPTYMINISKDINSAPSIINNIVENKNTKIKNKIDWIGLFDIITNNPLIIIKIEKIYMYNIDIVVIFIIYFTFFYCI